MGNGKINVLMMGLTPPLEGGSERHIYEISSRTKTKVFTQRGSICEDSIKVPIIKSPVILKSISFFFMSLLYSIFLVVTLKKKYDVIHIHENLLYFIAPLLKLRYEVVITVHGIKGFKFYDNKILWFLFGGCLSYADKIIAVNKEDEKLLGKEFENVTYIPNGVDLSLYKRINRKVENKITFIGRVNEQKGLIYLLEAFEEIKVDMPDLKLEIIGEVNEYARELQSKFPDKRIIWRGFISNRKDIVISLSSANMISLPSLWEGLPLTLFESLASGRPVIVSDIAAFESVADKSQVIFFKNKDSKDLANKIKSVLNGKSKIGDKGKKLASRYDWNTISKQVKEVYNK